MPLPTPSRMRTGLFVLFSSRRRHTRCDRDWSSDVCSSDLTGMNAEFVRERLFKPFETTKSAGMGIGVYESAQYVKSLGGEIRVDSAPAVGTKVLVLLDRESGVEGKSGDLGGRRII